MNDGPNHLISTDADELFNPGIFPHNHQRGGTAADGGTAAADGAAADRGVTAAATDIDRNHR